MVPQLIQDVAATAIVITASLAAISLCVMMIGASLYLAWEAVRGMFSND